MAPLALFLDTQLARVRRLLTIPVQRFTASPPMPTVIHGTVSTYRHMGCRCRRRAFANLNYGRRWRAAHPRNGAT